MPTRILVERVYPDPPQRVWRALTDRGAINQWLMPTADFAPQVGAKFQFRVAQARGWRGWVDCQVLEVDEPRRLSYSWSGDDRATPTTVTWTLEPAPNNGTRLRLEHKGFTGLGRWFVAKLFMGPGWRRMLRKTLPDVLRRYTGETLQPPDALSPVDLCH